MYDDILVPTDGSDGTHQVLEHALALADEDSTVHSIFVVDRRLLMAADEEATDDIRASLEEDGAAALETVRTVVSDAGLNCVTDLQEGIPHRAIREYATDRDVDVIVMGTHGHTGRDRLTNLGSTTERVLQNGSVPVLVVDIE